MKLLIGLSLSFCIQEILNGLVKEEQVAFIISGTSCKDDETLIKLCDGGGTDEDDTKKYGKGYAHNYWAKNPEGKRIVLELHNSGRLVQPRLICQAFAHPLPYNPGENSGYSRFWVVTGKDIPEIRERKNGTRTEESKEQALQ